MGDIVVKLVDLLERAGIKSIDLVTRETGKKLLEVIEREFEKCTKKGIWLIDFQNTGALDYSCADELVCKILSRNVSGEYGQDVFFVVSGLNQNKKENLQVALEKRRLPIIHKVDVEKWEIIGSINNSLRATYDFIIKKKQVTAKDVCDEFNLELNAASMRLNALYKKRIVRRREKNLKEGGRLYIYEPILS